MLSYKAEHRPNGEGTTRSRCRATKTKGGSSPAPRKAKERADLVYNLPRAAVVRRLPKVRPGYSGASTGQPVADHADAG